MAVFIINGQEFNGMNEAQEALRNIWTAYKQALRVSLEAERLAQKQAGLPKLGE